MVPAKQLGLEGKTIQTSWGEQTVSPGGFMVREENGHIYTVAPDAQGLPIGYLPAQQGVSEGGYSGYDDNRTRGFAKRGREDDEYHVPDPVAPEYNIKVNGEVINRQPFANRAEALAWAKQAVAAGKLDPKTATLSPINKEGASISTTPGSIDPGGAVDNFKQQMANNTEIAYQKKQQSMAEGWSQKYKSSINCSHPKGFSQKAHCAGKKKHNEDMSMEAVCPDCGMCEAHGNSKVYDKCWTGYKKVPGKKRGEEGSCKKIGESVAEKLNLKTMDTDAVIKDFEKSNAPQFRGKTKEKRKQMAIAAKMGAMKKKKKIGESLEEWTTDSLASHLFEQELTYEDRLNNMLSKKLSK
jgi:hypothetical protein